MCRSVANELTRGRSGRPAQCVDQSMYTLIAHRIAHATAIAALSAAARLLLPINHAFPPVPHILPIIPSAARARRSSPPTAPRPDHILCWWRG